MEPPLLAPPADDHVLAPDGWRRAVIGVALGAAFGAVTARLVGLPPPKR